MGRTAKAQRHQPRTTAVGLRKWLAGVAATVVAAVVIWAVTSSDSPLFHGDSGTARILWDQNWRQVNEPLPHLGTSGENMTNREELLALLAGLDLATSPDLDRRKNALLQSVREASSRDDPTYNMVYTTEIGSQMEELRRMIRNEALRHGVAL